jgi:replication-associated recombination protein RarA
MTGERDPWVDVKTRHGLAADEVISALQKEIRRGQVENAALLAYEMVTTSPELEAFLWRRLLVISIEDPGSAMRWPPSSCIICTRFARSWAGAHPSGSWWRSTPSAICAPG